MFKYRTFRPRRTVPLAILLVVLGLGVLFFAKNQDALANFKPYYLASYEAAYKYQLGAHIELQPSTDYAKSVPVLLYHGIIADGGNTSSAEGYSVPVSSFNAQMLALETLGLPHHFH